MTYSDNLPRQWHALSSEEILKDLKVAADQGLTASEALERQSTYGKNVLAGKKEDPAWLRFLRQFNQPLVYILVIASVVTFILHEYIDSAVIFGVVFINAIIGFVQEAKALQALEALSRTLTTQASVIRDGQARNIDSTELVPGDIVNLTSGDRVPADIRLISRRDLQSNESALTGESLPVEKNDNVLPAETGLADRLNMLYASSLITYGQGRGVVVATGQGTEVGRISELMSSADKLQTPLTKKIAAFSHVLLYVIMGFSVITFIVGVWRGETWVDMFMATVALAVGAIPEGLPAAVTITLAIGVSRMAGRKAIIRTLPSVETLGSTTIICSDKTGTLTENQMTVLDILDGQRHYKITGTGYEISGEVLDQGRPLKTPQQGLSECLTAGLLCNDARLVQKEGRNEVEGDPTEGALIVAARKAAAHGVYKEPSARRIDSIPFESQHQYMAVLVETDSGRFIYMKGSIEKVLERCTDANAARILQSAEDMAGKGLRVLAFARRKVDGNVQKIHHEDLGGMSFVGLQGMIDPPRKEVMEAIKNCYTAGMQVKMITGDHVLTAKAIAQQLGLNKGKDIAAYSGKDLEGLDDAAFIEAAVNGAVFARVTPEQKLRLVKALQGRNNVVAMTGDGVNDAPALKQADIGVAMGRAGTEVAKEAADMVLVDDNFASIEAAVEEGRGVFDNLRKFIVWTLPTNLAEGLAIMIAIFFGLTLPILPVQILWINMTTAIFLGLMLAFEPKEWDIMQRPPHDPQMPILTKDVVRRMIFVGVLIVSFVYWLFNFEIHKSASDLPEARTAAATMLIFGELFFLFNCRSLTKSFFKIPPFSNKWLWFGIGVMTLAQLSFIYAPFMNRLFGSAPIELDTWGRILIGGAAILLAVEFEKWMVKRFERKDEKRS